MKINNNAALALAFSGLLFTTGTALAQDPDKIWLRDGPHRLLDTPEIIAEMEVARDLAGDDFSFLRLQRLQCADIDDNGTIDQTPGSNANDPRNPSGWKEVPAIPTKVFDNVYYVGGKEVGGWLIDTGDGYIMLDSSYDYGYEEILLPNMAALGLDPSKIKYILITHAGPDHIGAAGYFQDNFGTEIVFDGSFRGDYPKATIMGDGDTLTLGDTTITMVQTPRNVGGTGLSFLIPVKINGKKHLWATFGNTGIVGGIADKYQYQASMDHFIGYVDALGADIAMSSHPFVDASLVRMEMIRECQGRRKHGHHKDHQYKEGMCRSNPFLIGKKSARRYFEIMKQCSVVQTKRHEAGLNNTGLEYLEQ